MKVKFFLGIGIASGKQEEIVELPDELVDDAIEDEFREWRNGYIDSYWEKIVTDGSQGADSDVCSVERLERMIND